MVIIWSWETDGIIACVLRWRPVFSDNCIAVGIAEIMRGQISLHGARSSRTFFMSGHEPMPSRPFPLPDYEKYSHRENMVIRIPDASRWNCRPDAMKGKMLRVRMLLL